MSSSLQRIYSGIVAVEKVQSSIQQQVWSGIMVLAAVHGAKTIEIPCLRSELIYEIPPRGIPVQYTYAHKYIYGATLAARANTHQRHPFNPFCSPRVYEPFLKPKELPPVAINFKRIVAVAAVVVVTAAATAAVSRISPRYTYTNKAYCENVYNTILRPRA